MRKLCALLAVLILFSCERKELDFDQVNDLEYRPRIEIPLVNAHLDLEDVESRDTNLLENPDKSLSIVYENDSVLTLKAADFVDIPDQDPNTVLLNPVSNPIDYEVDLGTIGGVELYDVNFYRGFLELNLRSPGYLKPAFVEIEIKNALDASGNPIRKSLTLPAGDTLVREIINLKGSDFDLTDNRPGEFNFIGFRLELLNPGDFNTVDRFELELQFKALEIDHANGFFGQRKIAFPAGNVDLDLSAASRLTDGITLTDPRISIIATSTVGLGVELQTDFKAVNEDNRVTDLEEDPATLAAANSLSEPSISRITLDKDNSNIVDFLNAVPSRILYSGQAEMNFNGRTSNFINRASELNVGLDIEVPLEVSIENLQLEEEVSFDLLDEDSGEISELELIFRSENGFPLSTNLKVEMLASNGEVLDSLEFDLLESAPTDNEGRSTGVRYSEDRLLLDQEAAEHLKNSETLRLQITLNSDQNSDFIKFYSDYAFNVRIAAIAQLQLEID